MGSGFGRCLQNRCVSACDRSAVTEWPKSNVSIHSTEVNRRGGMPFTYLRLGGLGYID